MNKIRLFIEKEIQKDKHRYLKELYNSGDFKPEELLYFFPNNYLKRNHMPMLQGGRKKRYKKYRLTSWRLFKIIEEVIDDTLNSMSINGEFFNKFVDIKDLNIGDTPWEKKSQDIIPTSLKTKWEVPVYTLNHIKTHTGAKENMIQPSVMGIPTTVLKCTTRSLPAEATYRKITTLD